MRFYSLFVTRDSGGTPKRELVALVPENSPLTVGDLAQGAKRRKWAPFTAEVVPYVTAREKADVASADETPPES